MILQNEDKIVLMSKQAQLEVEVGPKYIAEFVYGQEANPKLIRSGSALGNYYHYSCV